MDRVVLTGLDGSNPLAFMAALGALNAVEERNPSGAPAPRLRWIEAGLWRPELAATLSYQVGDGPRAGLLRALLEDLATWADEPALRLRYKKHGTGSEAWDLKPPPGVYRAYLRELLRHSGPDRRRSIDLGAALATEIALDNTGNTKPTALHFTAGQQEFLSMVDELRRSITEQDFEEALFGPWRYERKLPVLQWDATGSRDYALRARDPSTDKKLGVPAADWLAFRGLPFLRVVPVGNAIATTGCAGGWKRGRFCWPLWTVPIERDTVQSLLQLPGIVEMPEAERQMRGIGIVFECGIRRTDQGGYGSFTPASVV
jgi:hypothetical protein